MKQTNGYLYAATGEKFVAEAAQSAASLRAIQAGAHVTLVTNKPCENAAFDEIIVVDYALKEADTTWKIGLLFKAFALQHSPYERTFFVDTDTYFLADCQHLFSLLDFHDILIAHSPADVSKVNLKGQELEGYHPYNTGVMVFRKNEKTTQLLADWLAIYKEKFDLYPSDQTPFMEALLRNPVQLYVLLPFYNFREHFMVSLPPGKVKIVHGRPRDISDLSQKINSNLKHRTWLPRREKVIFRRPKSWKRRLKKWLGVNNQ